MKTVPVFEAKNRFSQLLAAAERGEAVLITRRGVPVAHLVAVRPEAGDAPQERIRTAIAALCRIRAQLTLEGDLKALAREGLD